ncbi:hypothetical protein [Mucilaginibacter sp. dw_454]|uniref:hypothetical protein n=1 Tax=Mucilaginibacter sp. dw_454 TaxID=2720079 RepID=UPI001BD39EC1|nr:hypothetical protein [Mucilaginibacter sp. dw_454]
MLPRQLKVLVCIVLTGIIGLSFSGANVSRITVFTVTTDTVKACGSSTTLTTQNVPGYSNPIWNDGTTGTSLTVTSPGDYWWQVTGTSVVTNGDFEAATTNSTTRGFTSSYTYKKATSSCNGCCCGVLSNEGTYTINTDPHNIHTNFTSMGDHTTGTGQMLIVNGAATANVTVWTQNINVQPNTDYVFSVWVTSVNPQNPAQLQFSIDGVPLGATISPSSNDGNWQYFTTTWNSGNRSGSLPIALVNQNIAASGNDFAVDDIVFAPVYRKNIHVIFNPIPVLALTGPNSACGTYDLTQTIINYDSATYNYVFTDSQGHVITDVNAGAITQSGTYTITEQNKVTGCTSAPVTTTITIKPNPQKPGISPSL